MTNLTIDDLRRIFETVAGADEDINLDGDITDTEFAELGYDSIAVLEVVAEIRREFGVSLDEDALEDVHTPRSLLELLHTAA
jgi:minimal PKS acyl carrier protein